MIEGGVGGGRGGGVNPGGLMIEGGVGGGSRRTGLDLGSGAVSGWPERKPQFSRDFLRHCASESEPWQCSRPSSMCSVSFLAPRSNKRAADRRQSDAAIVLSRLPCQKTIFKSLADLA